MLLKKFKILIINPFGIGDVLFTTPVVRNVRLAYPQAHIAYWANRRVGDFIKHNPDIDQVFVCERDELKSLRKWTSFRNEIQQEQFDLVFDFSLNDTFGFLCFAAGIKRRIGFDHRGRGRFLTDKVPLTGFEDKHVVDYFLDLLKCVDVPVVDQHLTLTVPPQDIQWAKDWLLRQDIDVRKPLVAVFPGGGASWGDQAKYRLWGPANYAHLIDKIIENFDAAVILMGDSKDRDLCNEVSRLTKSPLYDAVGQTSLLGLAALFKQCKAAIINDAGSVHVAVAAGVKALSIYGPVDPGVYGPYPPAEHRTVQKGLPCQPCYRRFRMPHCSHISCLRDLSVDEVYRKVQGLL